MDEDDKEKKSSNGQEQSTAQKASESINDTVNMAKDGASLAKNIQTGNVIGAVKDAVNLLKNKKFRRMLLINFIGSILPILLAGTLILGIFGAIGDFFEQIGAGLAAFGAGIVDALRIDESGIIQISDEEVDTIINGISAEGVSLDGLKLLGDVDYSNPDIEKENKEKARTYIRKFYEAQEITRTLNTKPDWIESLNAGSRPYGNVYVHRDLDDSDKIEANKDNQLEFMEYKKFLQTKSNIESNMAVASSIYNYFSIDENGYLVYADTNTYGDPAYGNSKSEIIINHVNYLDSIAPYTTSMNFYIYLTMISKNPEFASKVADLAKRSEIRIMILNDGVVTDTKIVTKYDQNKQKVEKEEKDGKTTYKEGELNTEKDKQEERTYQNNISDSRVVVTYVKTWFSEQTINYEVEEDEVNVDTKENEKGTDENKPEMSLTEENVGKEFTWKTNVRKDTTVTTTRKKYKKSTASDVVDKTGDKDSQGVNGDGKVDDNTTFIGLMYDEFDIPNSSAKSAAGPNLVSGAEMLFELLKNHETTQSLEQYMRYVMNKYKNTTKYGNIKYEDLAKQFSIREISSGKNYTVDTSTSAKSLCITDKSVLKKAIDNLNRGEDVKKNLNSQLDAFLGMQKEYNVNAVFAIAVSIVESGAGTAKNCPNDYSITNNWWNVTITPDSTYYNLHDYNIRDVPKGAYPDKTYYYSPTSGNELKWRVYKDASTGVYRFGDLIANTDGLYFKANATTVQEIEKSYCPNGEWANSVIAIMSEIYEKVGIQTLGSSTSSSSFDFVSGGIQNQAEADALNEKITKEYFKGTIPHPEKLYNTDEFIDWFSSKNDIFNLQTPSEPDYAFQCTWWAWGRASMYLESTGYSLRKIPNSFWKWRTIL